MRKEDPSFWRALAGIPMVRATRRLHTALLRSRSGTGRARRSTRRGTSRSWASFCWDRSAPTSTNSRATRSVRSTIPRSRRRLILWLAVFGLLFLSAVESSLAILREQIVAADAALKLALASEQTRVVQSASESSIPIVGQAVLGFVLPWVLALVAVPLEMLLPLSFGLLKSGLNGVGPELS